MLPEPEKVTEGEEALFMQTGVPLALIVAVGSGFNVTVADPARSVAMDVQLASDRDVT